MQRTLSNKYTAFGEGLGDFASSLLWNRYQFTGRENNWNGTMHYRARSYVPGLGRFTGVDPAGYADGPNLYGYARG